jgi:hypothetical protein
VVGTRCCHSGVTEGRCNRPSVRHAAAKAAAGVAESDDQSRNAVLTRAARSMRSALGRPGGERGGLRCVHQRNGGHALTQLGPGRLRRDPVGAPQGDEPSNTATQPRLKRQDGDGVRNALFPAAP